jgi:putative transposase
MVESMSRKEFEVKLVCRVLRVSRSGYYAWKRRPESERSQKNRELLERIREIHGRSRETYGVPRVQNALKELGFRHGKGRIARVMKKAGLFGVAKKRFKVRTTDSNHSHPIAERLVQTEDPQTLPVKPNQAWASDITYVPTKEGWLYVAIFLDLFTRKIVGFSMQDHLRAELVLDALEMALGRQCANGKGLVSHSDQGVQYACDEYRRRLTEKGITISHSRRGNCYDNAFAESFFHTLKVELVHRQTFETRKEAMQSIFEFIEVWYNRERLHSSLGYKSPVEYERIALAA